MTNLVSIDDFLNKNRTITMVDVRSPLEYLKGHIPGAVNIPLFTNRERVQVGICYKKEIIKISLSWSKLYNLYSH